MKNRLKNVLKKFPYTIFGSSNNNIMDDKSTIEYLMKMNKSLIRLGDGEVMMMRGLDIYYQKCDSQLSEALKKIIMEYNSNSPYLLCLPKSALEFSLFRYLIKGHFKDTYLVFFTFRYIYKKYLEDCGCKYGDTYVFNKKNKEIYSRLWINKQYVIFVHNQIKYFNNFVDMYGKEKVCRFIQVPSQNSYSSINQIEQRIYESFNGINLAKTIVLISAGPCSKELIFRINNKYAVQCIDTGHCWDTPLKIRIE